MTDIVDIGPSDPALEDGDIVYAVGPTLGQRLAEYTTAPAALGLTSLIVAIATLTVAEPATEFADVHAIASSGSQLAPYRWAAGGRMIVAVVALLIGVAAARRLAGSRPKVRVQVGAIEDDRTIDDLEAVAIASVPSPPAWIASVVGAAMFVSFVTLLINAAVFAYAMASHTPPPTPVSSGF